jgi:hypothetical protein
VCKKKVDLRNSNNISRCYRQVSHYGDTNQAAECGAKKESSKTWNPGTGVVALSPDQTTLLELTHMLKADLHYLSTVEIYNLALGSTTSTHVHTLTHSLPTFGL